MQKASHAEKRLSYMYVTHFNRGRIISLTKLDTRRRRRRRRRSSVLAVAGVHKMKQIPQEKLRGKSKSFLKAEQYLPGSSLKQRDRLHPYIPPNRQSQWTRRKKTRHRRASIRV
jgi:hypothetical protein